MRKLIFQAAPAAIYKAAPAIISAVIIGLTIYNLIVYGTPPE